MILFFYHPYILYIFKKAIYFFSISRINKIGMKIINDIKITIIVPVFNCENSIKSTIRSIQNQIMKETEIILIMI